MSHLRHAKTQTLAFSVIENNLCSQENLRRHYTSKNNSTLLSKNTLFLLLGFSVAVLALMLQYDLKHEVLTLY